VWSIADFGWEKLVVDLVYLLGIAALFVLVGIIGKAVEKL